MGEATLHMRLLSLGSIHNPLQLYIYESISSRMRRWKFGSSRSIRIDAVATGTSKRRHKPKQIQEGDFQATMDRAATVRHLPRH